MMVGGEIVCVAKLLDFQGHVVGHIHSEFEGVCHGRLCCIPSLNHWVDHDVMYMYVRLKYSLFKILTHVDVDILYVIERLANCDVLVIPQLLMNPWPFVGLQ